MDDVELPRVGSHTPLREALARIRRMARQFQGRDTAGPCQRSVMGDRRPERRSARNTLARLLRSAFVERGYFDDDRRTNQQAPARRLLDRQGRPCRSRCSANSPCWKRLSWPSNNSNGGTGFIPDYAAPIVRNQPGGRELTMARWGMPSPVFALKGKKCDPGVTNVLELLAISLAYGSRWLAFSPRIVARASVPWLKLVWRADDVSRRLTITARRETVTNNAGNCGHGGRRGVRPSLAENGPRHIIEIGAGQVLLSQPPPCHAPSPLPS
jgi:hypothetical protein